MSDVGEPERTVPKPGAVDEALMLLDQIAFRGWIAEAEKVPAWRAIKRLYRAGASVEACNGLVSGVRGLGVAYRHGPTLTYWTAHVRNVLAQA